MKLEIEDAGQTDRQTPICISGADWLKVTQLSDKVNFHLAIFKTIWEVYIIDFFYFNRRKNSHS